jgi:predicted acylesterase/phospholipase RssA
MAGAVSAGAYTAGVMDYLLEALEEWERRKREDPANTPAHQVEIPVIGGASAGGMTSIITAAALHGALPPVRWKEGDGILAPRPGNRLYHSWVDLTAEDMFPLLLDTADIEKDRTRSLLNATFIDAIAARAVKVDAPWTQRPYIAERLKLFTTLTNLAGLRFDITFNTSSAKGSSYYISAHNDYACFELNTTDAEYGGHGWIPLDFPSGLNTALARDAAMATGAFPVGLRARRITRDAKHVNDMDWLKEVTSVQPLKDGPYSTINVDGGLINNEPFERVRAVLNGITGEGHEVDGTGYKDFDLYSRTRSTVLMIDPFPSSLEQFEDGELVTKVMANTLGAMMGQLRTKPAALAEAMHSDKAGQYLVAPSRKLPAEATRHDPEMVYGSDAIACGTLGGFGGFLHKEFRVHDFFLGRANCEKFLRDQFTIRESAMNPLIEQGYAHIADRKAFRSRTDAQPGLQIIPIFTPEAPRMPMPVFACGTNWPMRQEGDIDRFRKPIKQRVDAVITDQVRAKGLQSALLWIGRRVLLNGKVADAVIGRMKTSLQKSRLLQ